jgi:hypothetical protein
VRRLSLWEYLASFATAPEVISLFVFFAAMPTPLTLLNRNRVRTIS